MGDLGGSAALFTMVTASLGVFIIERML